MPPKACPRCLAYLLDHLTLLGWKLCPGCGWACDSEGKNLQSQKESEEPNKAEVATGNLS